MAIYEVGVIIILMEKSSKILLWVISLSVVAVILSTGYKFLIQKDYDFIVEAACDPLAEACFYRDCSEGDCPPNELEYYKTFLVPASDFPRCSDNSCAPECSSETIACEEIICDEAEGEDCSVVEEDEFLDSEDVPESLNSDSF